MYVQHLQVQEKQLFSNFLWKVQFLFVTYQTAKSMSFINRLFPIKRIKFQNIKIILCDTGSVTPSGTWGKIGSKLVVLIPFLRDFFQTAEAALTV